jgi:hypothetical protein
MLVVSSAWVAKEKGSASTKEAEPVVRRIGQIEVIRTRLVAA